MDERYIAAENTYTQQNYLIQLCMGCTDHLSELEARYHKAQAEAWQHRARQLKDDNLVLHDKVDMLQRHLAWYRAKVGGLKAENERLREKLAMYRELELALNGGNIDTTDGIRKRAEKEGDYGPF